MNGIMLAGGWLATVWIHFFILSLVALVIAHCVGIYRVELRDAAWKAALVCGLFTAGVHLVLPGIGWGSVVMLQARGTNLPNAGSDDAAPMNSDSLARESTSSSPSDQPQIAASAFMGPFIAPPVHSVIRLACFASTAAFGIGLVVGLARFARATQHLWYLVGRARPCERTDLVETFCRLQSQLGISRKVDLLVSEEIVSPLATGIMRPRVLVPAVALDGRLDDLQLEGLLAHELAHHKLRDPLWAVIGHLITHAFWFQPLAHVIRRNMRSDAEYLADSLACRTLGDGLGLARCLATMAEWLVPRSDARLEIGGAHLFARRASLKHRVASLLVDEMQGPPPSLIRRWLIRTAIVGILAILIAAAPVVKSESPNLSLPGGTEVNRTLVAMTLAASFTAPAIADEPKVGGQEARETTTERRLPESVHGFSGEVVGTILSKDTDGASLVLKVQQVTNVWKNSKADKPRDLVGRTVPVEKFFGRFLDVLLVVKPGDTVKVEVKHVRGDQLQFLGELFKKVEPVSSQENPQVDGADRPAKPATDKPAGEPQATNSQEQDQGNFPAGLQGFRGILLGKVVKTDVEKGVLVFQAESVKRTWPQNKATNPGSSKGKEITVNGIAGKWLDVLLVLKPGDRIEVEAFHNRGEALDFVQEWLKKVD
jgi:beta-lactamase regulating signal transducer with metallopeptidase domain